MTDPADLDDETHDDTDFPAAPDPSQVGETPEDDDQEDDD